MNFYVDSPLINYIFTFNSTKKNISHTIFQQILMNKKIFLTYQFFLNLSKNKIFAIVIL